MFYYFYYKTRK